MEGISLLEKLEEIWKTYGYYLNTLHSYEFPGSVGMKKMNSIMSGFHKGLGEIGGLKVEKTLDYSQGLDGLPKSDVLKYVVEGDCSVVVRPSGTEPKLKTYTSVSARDRIKAETIEAQTVEDLQKWM